MARTYNGSSQYSYVDTGLGITGNDPVWASFWLWVNSTAASYGVFNIGISGSTNHYRRITSGGGNINAVSGGAGVTGTASAALAGAAQWQHVLAEWGGTNTRKIAVNGGAPGANTTSINITSDPSQIRFAATLNLSAYMAGRLAWIGIFSGVPTDDQKAAAAAGLHPVLLSPATLLDAWDKYGVGTETSWRGNPLTLVNSPTQSHSPRIFLPHGRSMIVVPSGAAEQDADSTPAIATWTAPAATATPGAVTATSSPATATWTAPAATATAGAVTVNATAAAASWAAPDATATSGAFTATSSPATASWSAPAATATPGAATATSTAAAASWVAPDATATGAGQSVSTPAVTTWVAPAATAQAGAVTVDASPAVATWAAPDATASGGNTVTATASSLSWVAPAATATTTATVAAAPAVSAWSAPAATATPGAVTSQSAAALATWVAPDATASDGSIPTYTTILIGAARAGTTTIAARAGRTSIAARSHLSE